MTTSTTIPAERILGAVSDLRAARNAKTSDIGHEGKSRNGAPTAEERRRNLTRLVERDPVFLLALQPRTPATNAALDAALQVSRP
jgi:hypothetical protein